MSINEIICRFFLEDVGGIYVINDRGETLFCDDKAKEILREATRWATACPAARAGQRGELWDLPNAADGKAYMVITSTFEMDGGLIQVHHFMDNSLTMELFRDINDYSRELKAEKERDGLTGLYNKGKLMELKQSLFRDQDMIAVFNMDVNNLKQMNDNHGHEAGDSLLRKAAESLHLIEARNVLTFRVGGDEFLAVALHVSAEEAEALRRRWEEGLARLNRRDDGVECIVACGMVHATRGYDLEAVFAEADRLMYEDKLLKKGNAVR